MAVVDGLGAAIKDGSFVETASAASTASTAKAGDAMDKDAFLQLLVAQMKYQDPLEPTSNTEYISQYATFSELEQMQNMSASMELSRASSYVGQEVVIRTTLSSGEVQEINGVVEYVIYENNKAMVSVDGALYSASDIYATKSAQYSTAVELATAFVDTMDAMPSVDNLSLSDEEVVENLREGFNNMTKYQQSMIPAELISKLQEYVDRMAILNFKKDVDDMPGADELTLDDEEKVTELNTKFGHMTEEQQELIPRSLRDKLAEAVARIDTLKEEAAAAITGETDGAAV